MPSAGRKAECLSGIDLPTRIECGEMTHPDIVIDELAVTKPFEAIDYSFGGKVITIVVSSADSELMFWNDRVVYRNDAAGTDTCNVTYFDFGLDNLAKAFGTAFNKPGRNQADEHSVDVSNINPLAARRDIETRFEVIER
ncbi:hypothetical protein GCM10022211_16780 [Sphingomonas humi]|uniref:Uncharacterized protein n=1 Tax=Sphingomonas humi TaxID=335630 RepID=A0ABP7S1L5_9SPHN